MMRDYIKKNISLLNILVNKQFLERGNEEIEFENDSSQNIENNKVRRNLLQQQQIKSMFRN
jgi:hypothetical protein